MITRGRVRGLVEHHNFQRFIIAVIVVNAVTLALETSTSVVADYGPLLRALDTVALSIFVAELSVKLAVYGWQFFRDPWNVFDFVIVAIALVPASGPFAVLRALRILRVLRLISAVPAMRRVVTGLLAAVPGMASIAALLALIIFVAAVMTTRLFRDIAPEYFGHLGRSLFTLFQVMTGEGWPDVAGAVMAEAPAAWVFFVIYILVSSFAVLNLFIAVVVSAMEDQVRADLQVQDEQQAAQQAEGDERVLAELRALREEVESLRRHQT
ncbi:ion transporter [Haloechinothrix sp. YIM 98757]|uniref:Ion transporter n=1 Tax=Haloechinothrix aidingensis TaxID=2752311 RepID=A0A838AF01_9PSEU|nr:ion transporter [Haloechinothrix aidingensis]